MKILLCLIFTLFTLNLYAADNVKLVEVKGETPSGKNCVYAVYTMNSWEGQTVVFMQGPHGDFRMDLNTDKFLNGTFASHYSDSVEMSFSNSVLKSFYYAASANGEREEIRISLKNDNLLTPSMVMAQELPAHYSCMF